MIILSIDTSCDETSVAVTRGHQVLSNVISSQVRYHKKFGGVVPFLAQRLHNERIDSVVELALQRAGLEWKDMDAIAVTRGPGLAPALEVGIQKAKALAVQHALPLYGVNHMAGHIASCFAQIGSKASQPIITPALAVLVSGGHTEMVVFKEFGNFQVIGQTLDDALGEAYDKVAKMLGLGYPGGPLVAKLAKDYKGQEYPLPTPMQRSGDLNLSYSGLKNAVRLLIYELKGGTHTHIMEKEEIAGVCYSFQKVAQGSLLFKVEKAVQQFPEIETLLLAGGVAANTELRKSLRALAKKYQKQIVFPANMKLCTDNAAMIGVAAFLGIQAGQKPIAGEELDRQPNASIDSVSF